MCCAGMSDNGGACPGSFSSSPARPRSPVRMRATSLVVLVVSFISVLLPSKALRLEAIPSLPVWTHTSSMVPRVVHGRGDATGLSTTGADGRLRRMAHLRSHIPSLLNNNEPYEELVTTAKENRGNDQFHRKPLQRPRTDPTPLTLPDIILGRVARRLVARVNLEELVATEWQSFLMEQLQRRVLGNAERPSITDWNGESRHQKINKRKVFSGTTPEILNIRGLNPSPVFGAGDPELEEEEGRGLWLEGSTDTNNYAQPSQSDIKTFSFHKFVHNNRPSHWEGGGVTLARGLEFLTDMDKSLKVPSEHLTLPSQHPKDDSGNWGDRTFVDTGLKEGIEGQHPPFEVRLGFSVPVNQTSSLKFLNIMQLNDYRAPLLDTPKPLVETDLETGFGPASSTSQVNHFPVNSQHEVTGHPLLDTSTMSLSANPTVQSNNESPASSSVGFNEAMHQLRQTFRIQTDKTFSSEASPDVSSKSNKNFIGLSQIKDGGAETAHINPNLFSSVNTGSELNEAFDVSTEHMTPEFKLRHPPIPSTSLTVPPIEERAHITEPQHGINHSPSHPGQSENRGDPHEGTHMNNPGGSKPSSHFFATNTQDPKVDSTSSAEVNSNWNKDEETILFLNLGNTMQIEGNSDEYRLERAKQDHKLHDAITTEHGEVTYQSNDGEDQRKNIQTEEIKKFRGENGLNSKESEGAGGGTHTSQFKEIYLENIPDDLRYYTINNEKITDHQHVRERKGPLWGSGMDTGDKDIMGGHEMVGFHRRKGESSVRRNNNDVAMMKDFKPSPQVCGENPSAAIPVVVAPRLQEEREKEGGR
ncbi:uncharacterized protein LOC127007578 [Eriocheir sinensis]|uniref:uncharacterized protein LOC127007578 n=1 Tax=Eriocheir sinensis TaxID=95602 RepID=UPI0021CA18EE|nr:uncharacterized protein LOC127007578 [Eriocheir sinensis]